MRKPPKASTGQQAPLPRWFLSPFLNVVSVSSELRGQKGFAEHIPVRSK